MKPKTPDRSVGANLEKLRELIADMDEMMAKEAAGAQ
jgi:hypothetical protein